MITKVPSLKGQYFVLKYSQELPQKPEARREGARRVIWVLKEGEKAPKKYNSIKSFEEEFGVSRSTIDRRMDSTDGILTPQGRVFIYSV